MECLLVLDLLFKFPRSSELAWLHGRFASCLSYSSGREVSRTAVPNIRIRRNMPASKSVTVLGLLNACCAAFRAVATKSYTELGPAVSPGSAEARSLYLVVGCVIGGVVPLPILEEIETTDRARRFLFQLATTPGLLRRCCDEQWTPPARANLLRLTWPPDLHRWCPFGESSGYRHLHTAQSAEVNFVPCTRWRLIGVSRPHITTNDPQHSRPLLRRQERERWRSYASGYVSLGLISRSCKRSILGTGFDR
ncbi:hypothetical protein F5887DRAFT_298823 [Amanita rubescens]|nr:hypothetical protein F5887DRAFT_298823 [Amanita rubescens]